MRRIITTFAIVAGLAAIGPSASAHQTLSPFSVVTSVNPAHVANGATATLTLHTRIGATCVANVIYDDGSTSTALVSQHVGGTGIVQWRWQVHTAAPGGTASGACEAKGQEAIGQARFAVSPAATNIGAAGAVLGTYSGDNTTKPDYVGAFRGSHFVYRGTLTITFTGTQIDPKKNASGTAFVQADVKETVSLTDNIAIAPRDTPTQTVRRTFSEQENDCKFGCTVGIVEPMNLRWHIVVTKG